MAFGEVLPHVPKSSRPTTRQQKSPSRGADTRAGSPRRRGEPDPEDGHRPWGLGGPAYFPPQVDFHGLPSPQISGSGVDRLDLHRCARHDVHVNWESKEAAEALVASSEK
jgi:hypothetical protein